MSDDDVFEKLKQAVDDSPERSRNEADTRHRLIDLVLHDVLSWPRNRVSVEEYIRPGYADYVLRKSNNEPIILVEAKREGQFFQIPHETRPEEQSGYIGIQKLMSDDAIKIAINQVRSYCVDVGCEYAAITNGHEWIFFKTFEKAQRWDAGKAFVIRRLSFFLNEYTKGVNSLSYHSIIDKASLPVLLTSMPPKDRGIYYPRDRINTFSRSVDSNRLASVLRPLVSRYFGVIDDANPEFMKRCYVSQRDDQSSLSGIRSLIHDGLTPYLADYGVKQLHNDSTGGQIGEKITKAVRNNRKGEVLVLFGGKGAGKSTFIRRLLHHETPKWLRDHAAVVILDLLNVPENIDEIRKFIWNNIVLHLDKDNLLQADRSELISSIFREKFEVANRQDLAGLSPDSEAYNLLLNGLVAGWKSDQVYCAQRLVRNLQLRGKGAVIVLDNTDQYSGPIQDFCFTSAQEVAETLGCTALISMREERFYNSKMHGVLDAFQNSGFHISSPQPAEVFRKRVKYVEDLLTDQGVVIDSLDGSSTVEVETAKYLQVIQVELYKRNSHLTNFLTACAHGDTRLSLDLFRSFMLSGYTNVDEILSARSWDFQIHQVLKPVMVPSRFFYDETISDIPNIFELRHNRHCSHFTALRILRKLAKLVEGSSATYLPVAQLHSYFAETFNMSYDMEANLDILLKKGFVESRNRLDYFSEDVDALKITPYGVYMLNDLAYYFSYLDLICVDCGIFDQEVSNYLAEAARQEFDFFLKKDRIKRIELRLDRADKFISYLQKEEFRERELYSLQMPEEEMFTTKAKDVFVVEKERVSVSANRRTRRY